MITLGAIAILATSWLVDILLIDGLNVDKGLLGSVLGGVIGALGVTVTTYFIIDANKQATRDAADLQDQKEKERYFLQLTISNSEDTLVKLSELKDDLINFQHKILLAKINLKGYSYSLARENELNDSRRNDNFDRFAENYNSTLDIKIKINKLLMIIKTRSSFYKNISFNALIYSFEKYSTKVNELFWVFIQDQKKCEEVLCKIKNKDKELIRFITEIRG